jgi:uncharacterized membrane protein YkvI
MFIPLIAILAYPPYAIGFGTWLSSPPSNGYLFFGVVFFILVIAFLYVWRRGKKPAAAT